ncbi:MAG: glycine cleavage T C-terminal barrel domain-containing protein [Phycisphaerae bacterium]|nr:glycine cleavage T C-terminal barrel domain-containing protein [Phycisphaerae bacterium]
MIDGSESGARSMLHDSPLRAHHASFAAAEAERVPMLNAEARPGAATGRRLAVALEYLPYAVPPTEGTNDTLVCGFVGSFGSVEPEYAAIRRGAALFDAAQRGTIVVSGSERRDFLQRMVTQDVKTLSDGMCRRSFWLNRKGRIEADLVIAELGDVMEIYLDASRAASTVASLREFVFSEEVSLEDVTATRHHLELHGPNAGRILALAGATRIPAEGEAARTTVAGVPVVLVRSDTLGERGWTIVVERRVVGDVWNAIVSARDPLDAEDPNAHRRRARPMGWHAYNIARVEAGTPLFFIDFGPTNLPHESGVLRDRVSFKKGCYLGQEVVARMESLGKPKQILAHVRPLRDLLPVAGGQVFERTEDGAMGAQIGTITSSSLAPMLSASPIAFAMVRTRFAEAGTLVIVNAEGEQCEATLGPLHSVLPGAGTRADQEKRP